MRVSAEVAGAFVLATFAGCASSPISLNDQQISAVERVARVDMAQQNIPGMAIGIGLNGTTVYARGFGTRGEGKPVDAGTIFRIGSITKQFTAACVMLLVQEGRISSTGLSHTMFPTLRTAVKSPFENCSTKPADSPTTPRSQRYSGWRDRTS